MRKNFITVSTIMTLVFLSACESAPKNPAETDTTVVQATAQIQELKKEENLEVPTPEESVIKTVATDENTEIEVENIQSLIKEGKTAQVEELFQTKVSINEIDEQGDTALHVAARTNNVDLLSFLLFKGADADLKNNEGETALHVAIKNNGIESSAILAPIGNALLFKDGNGKTALELAMEKGKSFYPAVLTTETGKQQDGLGRTILHYLVIQKNTAAVNFCIEKKLPLSIKDINDFTPLHYAYKNGESTDSIRIAAALILANAAPVRGDCSFFEDAIKTRNPSLRFDEGQTPLHIATILGQKGMVGYLIERGALISAKDISGSTPLHEAIRYGRLEIAKMLLESGANVNARDSMNKTPLLIISPSVHRESMYELLLSKGADANAKDLYGDTPLHIATMIGTPVSVLKNLIESGADYNERNKKGVTPLSLAVERKTPDVIAYFGTMGADINAEDMNGNTPLSRALESNLDVTKQLVTKSNLNSRDSYGNTPLHIAILHNADNAQVKYLIDSGAEVNARNRNGDSPLYLAVRGNLRFAGELLLSKGADVFATNTENYSPLRLALASGGDVQDWLLTSQIIKATDGIGNTPLHYAAEWKLDDSVSILLEKGAKPNTQNTNGETPLFYAVKANSPSTIELLIKNGGSLNQRDFLGNTALHACIRYNSLDATGVLLGLGAAIDVQNISGKTPLHEASSEGRVSIANLLLDNNASINTVDATGKTALIDAIQARQIDLVKILLQRGASPMIQEMYGRNAYHEAAATKDIELISIIRNAGGNPLSRDTHGETPLSLVLKSDTTVITAVLGENLNLSDSDGNTPIHIAIMNNSDASIIKMLIDKNYPVNRRNSSGLTPLLLAIQGNMKENTQILLENKADPYISDNKGECAVSYAIKNNQEILNMIVQCCAQKQDMAGEGILHYAAREADEATVKQLLSMGLNRSLKNISGESAYDIAVRWQRSTIAALLQ